MRSLRGIGSTRRRPKQAGLSSLLDPLSKDMDPLTELLLYTDDSGKKQDVLEEIIKTLSGAMGNRI
jgi:hypothetical protein